MRRPKIIAHMPAQLQAAKISHALIIAPNGRAHQKNQGSVQKYLGKSIDVTKRLEVLGNFRKKRVTAKARTRLMNVRSLIMISNWI